MKAVDRNRLVFRSMTLDDVPTIVDLLVEHIDELAHRDVLVVAVH